MDKKELRLQILKDLTEGVDVDTKNYGVDKERLAEAVESLSDAGYIKNASVQRGGQGNRALVIFLRNVTITISGEDYLEENN